MGNEPQGRTAGVPGQAVPAMTDIERALAEALKIIPVPSTYEEWQARVDASYEDDARTLLATEPMQLSLIHI